MSAEALYDTDVQRPLSLRWEHRAHWPALQKEYGGSEATAAVILAVVTASCPVSYSRNRNHYVWPLRYRDPLYTYVEVTRSVDYLSGQGLIHHDKVPRGNRGRQSSMTATPELIEGTNKIIALGQPLIMRPPREGIILRDAERDPVDYKDTPAICRMRRRLEQINEGIRSTLITGVLPCPVVRIFNRTFKRGGRFYALGGGWQSMSKEARKQITIGGEPVVEIDYKTLHPAILYAQARAPLPKDSYDLPGWPRPLVKRALLILVNSRNEPQARMSIAHQPEMEPVASPGSQDAISAAARLMRDIKRAHRPIAWSFHSDKGAELMAIDSAIAETVMHIMMMAGIVVLPVHDSFLVQESQALKLEEAMIRAAYESGFEALQVSYG